MYKSIRPADAVVLKIAFAFFIKAFEKSVWIYCEDEQKTFRHLEGLLKYFQYLARMDALRIDLLKVDYSTSHIFTYNN